MLALQLWKDGRTGETHSYEQTIFRGSRVAKGPYLDELGLTVNKIISLSRRSAEILASLLKRANERAERANELADTGKASKKWTQKRANKERAKRRKREKKLRASGHPYVNSSSSSQSEDGDGSSGDKSSKKEHLRIGKNS